MKNKITFTLIIVLISLVFSCKKIVKNDYLYKITNENIETEQLKQEPLIWAAEIELNVELLKSDRKKQLNIILEDKKVMNITLEHFEISNKITKWHGTITKSQSSQLIFIITPTGIVAGDIRLATGEYYKIRYFKEGKYFLAKIEASKYQEDIPSLKIEPNPNEVPIDHEPCANTDPADKIDVMVLYTEDARVAAGSVDAIESEILLAIEYTNTAYINSNVTQRINLVYLAEVNYAETGNVNTDAASLRGKTDGVLDDIHTLRDDHSADLVSLIVETLDYAGGAYTMETVSTAFETYGFAVIKRVNAAGSYSFAHELGHNMGCQHDCDNNDETVPYEYSHGYYNTDPTPVDVANWRTIMSYNPTPSATRILYFSNPGITYPPGAPDGDVMGTTTGDCQADNHQSLNNTALTVANFRCSGSNVENVWMKDTWNDTGLEPDPNTVSESMYKSPYIWVRNEQDVDKVYEHQHQNPIFGEDNWIYVKLHNGGAAMDGTLEVYYANASVSLSWPAEWTKIDEVDLNIPASYTEIAEIKWSGLPGTGHYCLVARWVSDSDPMTTAEGADISTNVRENNNLIWKNINIVEAVGGDEPVSATAIFKFKDPRSSIIRIICNDKYPNKSFAQFGLLTVEFDKESQKLLGNWTPKNQEIVKEGEKFIIKGTNVDFREFPFNKGHKGEIRLTFQAYKETPKMIYFVDIVQLVKEGEKEREIGGVSYEVNTQLK